MARKILMNASPVGDVLNSYVGNKGNHKGGWNIQIVDR